MDDPLMDHNAMEHVSADSKDKILVPPHNGLEQAASDNGSHGRGRLRGGSPSPDGVLLEELHQMTDDMLFPSPSPGSPIVNGQKESTTDCKVGVEGTDIEEEEHALGMDMDMDMDMDEDAERIRNDRHCGTRIGDGDCDVKGVAAAGRESEEEFGLPRPMRVADESEEVLDAVDEEMTRLLRERYASELAAHPSVDRMHLIRRYVIGYRFVKKKKRFAAICKDLDLYWRNHRQFDFDNIIQRESTEQQKKAWRQFLYGQDYYGHPVMYDTIAGADLHEFSNEFLVDGEPFGETAFRHLFAFMRRAENLKIAASRRFGVTIYRQVQIMDVRGFTSDHLRGKNKKMTKMVVDSLSRMYPEGTHRMYIINAPWPFRACWTMVKNFMDDATVKRTKVLGEDWLKEVLKEVPIEMIPPEYGGKGKWAIRYGGAPKDYPLSAMTGLD